MCFLTLIVIWQQSSIIFVFIFLHLFLNKTKRLDFFFYVTVSIWIVDLNLRSFFNNVKCIGVDKIICIDFSTKGHMSLNILETFTLYIREEDISRSLRHFQVINADKQSWNPNVLLVSITFYDFLLYFDNFLVSFCDFPVSFTIFQLFL